MFQTATQVVLFFLSVLIQAIQYHGARPERETAIEGGKDTRCPSFNRFDSRLDCCPTFSGPWNAPSVPPRLSPSSSAKITPSLSGVRIGIRWLFFPNGNHRCITCGKARFNKGPIIAFHDDSRRPGKKACIQLGKNARSTIGPALPVKTPSTIITFTMNAVNGENRLLKSTSCPSSSLRAPPLNTTWKWTNILIVTLVLACPGRFRYLCMIPTIVDMMMIAPKEDRKGGNHRHHPRRDSYTGPCNKIKFAASHLCGKFTA